MKKSFACSICNEKLTLTGTSAGIVAGRDLWLKGHNHLDLLAKLSQEAPPEDTSINDLPAQYADAEGRVWVLCGCGHYAGGAIYWYNKKIDCCPNCSLVGMIDHRIPIPRPDRLTEETATNHDPGKRIMAAAQAEEREVNLERWEKIARIMTFLILCIALLALGYGMWSVIVSSYR